MTALMFGFIVTSCNNADLADGQNKPATRAGQVANLDLRDFGKVHNLIMDYGQSQLARNSGISPMSTDNEVLVGNLNNAIKDNMANFLRNTTISSLCGDMVDSMDDYLEYYGTYIDEHFLEPIPDSETNGKHIDGTSILEQAYNCGVLDEAEYDMLKRLSGIALDADNGCSLSTMSNQLQDALTIWEINNGKVDNVSVKTDGLASGICLQIGIYSCEWWNGSYVLISNNGPQRIAPWLAYLAGRDLKGAIRGTVKYIVKSYINGSEMTWEGAGTSALVGGVKSSIGGLFR